MALNPELIKYYVSRISNAEMRTFGSEVSQIFNHIDNEVKDNPVFLAYEEGRKEWEKWPKQGEGTFGGSWFLPSNLEKSKSLSYDLYRKISSGKEGGYNFVANWIFTGNIDTSIREFNKIFLDYFTQALQDIIRANPEVETNEPERVEGNTVFIIHGHDDHLKTEVQLLLERGGVRNVVLHEIADMGRTLIDKLIEEANSSNYAIALFSPDDIGTDGNKRARQNVILEVGYFMGLLGKKRVRILIKGEVEIPSDIKGILYEKHDEIGAWKMKILKELQAAGIFVDLKSVFEKF